MCTRSVALVIAVVSMALAAAPATAQPEQFPVQYMVKFVCGLVPVQPPGEEGPLKPGNYATAINIHNYTFTSPIFGSTRIALHYREGVPFPSLPPLVPVKQLKLWRYRTAEIDCPSIWMRTNLPPGTFVKGMVHIGIGQLLPVVAVYTSQTVLDPAVPPDAGAGHSIDVEEVFPFINQLPPD